MKAVLFPNLVEFPSLSMRRYAAELSTALRAARGGEWEMEAQVCHHVERAARVWRGPGGRQLAGRLGRLVKYPLQARKAAGDLFHILDHSHAHLALALDGRRTVLTCHDLIPLLAARGELGLPAAPGARGSFRFRLFCMRRCARIIAISQSTQRDLVRLTGVPAERIRVVPYGVNGAFTPAPATDTAAGADRSWLRARYGLPPEAKIILHVGTGMRYKNAPALLRALALLHQEARREARVWLVRVGPALFDDERALLHALGLGARLVEAGTVQGDAELARFYRGADVFAFPSLWEGFGWPPLEAMACGTPVVAANAASLPEVVGDAGLLVDPRDPGALARALDAVLRREDLHRSLAARGRERARQFTWERTAQQTLAVYEEVIREKNSGFQPRLLSTHA
jgi:glycosyltransferase involved in cell wall biosynthesis